MLQWSAGIDKEVFYLDELCNKTFQTSLLDKSESFLGQHCQK